MPVPAPAPALASVDIATVRERFNFEWATADSSPVEGVDTYWWWARSIRVDPAEVIADDGEGHLWSVPFSTDGEAAVTFGAPTQVRETYVPVAAGDGVAATAVVTRRRQRVLASALERPRKDARASDAPPPDPDPSTGGTRMPITLSDEQADALGLTDLDDAARASRLAELAADPDDGDETDDEEEPEPVAASTGDTVTLDRATYETLRAGAEAGQRADTRLRETDRDAAVAAAVGDGRIPHSRADHWRTQWDADPVGAAATLGRLERGLIPVAERGRTGGDDPDPVRAGFDERRARMSRRPAAQEA